MYANVISRTPRVAPSLRNVKDRGKKVVRARAPSPYIDFGTLVRDVENDRIYSVVVDRANTVASIVGKDEESYTSRVILSDSFLDTMVKHDVKVFVNDSSFDYSLLIMFFPVIFYFIVAGFLRNQGMGGMGPGNLIDGKKRDFEIIDDLDITFNDVAGIDTIRDEVSEVVEFVKNPQKFDVSGAKVPRGCLLVGKPGTGKTLIAKAIASEADVPFLATSASQFVELFVGMGAARIRKMFSRARENAPCILFIDEIDAIGKKRSGNISIAGGNDEREQTLNQLLTEMDGFENNSGVIVIAATNRREILDDALTRPGRFDRVIALPLPDVDGREKILEVHSKNKTLSKDVMLRDVARVTAGQSGAELQNIMNEAAIYAARSNRRDISNEDINAAFEKTLLGLPSGQKYTDEQRRTVAYHEAGHALVGMIVGDDDVGKISIVPRSSSGGVTVFVPDENAVDGWYTKSYLENKIKIGLGGHAAEDLVNDDVTTGALSDFEQVTNIARNMVTKFGLSDIGKVFINDAASDNTKMFVDKEIRKIVKTEYDAVIQLLSKHRTKLDALADMLVKDGEVDGKYAEHVIFER
jgi:cell division protease FtsH